jgi:hypothetical protein
LKSTDRDFTQCTKINSQSQQCYINHLMAYARAAQRTLLLGQDPQPQLISAFASLANTRQIGGSFLDGEQYTMLAHWIDARHRLRLRQDPALALGELAAANGRCQKLAAQDVMCTTLAAQAEWVASEWAALQNRPVEPPLLRALGLAKEVTEHAPSDADGWQVLAETQLRLGSSPGTRAAARDAQWALAQASLDKVFAANPNHALGHAMRGALELYRAQALRDPTGCRIAAQSAVRELELAFKHDPFLRPTYSALVAQAQGLACDAVARAP